MVEVATIGYEERYHHLERTEDYERLYKPSDRFHRNTMSALATLALASGMALARMHSTPSLILLILSRGHG